MRLADILREKGIEDFCAVSVADCLVGNERLYSQLPKGCFAVFMLFPYYPTEKNSRLAAFAAVPDYHLFARELFSELEEYIKGKYGVFARGFTDHSPLEERDAAAKCALGVIGRHGLLINEKYSSFICIGELICALSEKELADEGIQVKNEEIKYCEGCGKCLERCPAGCADGDKSNCISAITQKKGELTDIEAEAIRKSGSIWGCDRCQLACPYTERAIKNGTVYSRIPFFGENILLGNEDAVEALGDEEYRRYTFSYRKRNVMMRNIEIIREGKK